MWPAKSAYERVKKNRILKKQRLSTSSLELKNGFATPFVQKFESFESISSLDACTHNSACHRDNRDDTTES